MKKLFLTALFIGLISASFGQFIYMKTADIAKIKEATIVVALSNDADVNKGLEEFLSANWTSVKYQLIKLSELGSYTKKNPKNYVVTYLKQNKKIVHSNMALNTGGARDQIATREDHMIFLENVKNPSSIKTTEALFKSFVDFNLEEEDELAECIRELQQLYNVLTYPILNDKELGIFKQITHYPTSDEKKITDKELWLTAEETNIDAAKAEKVYPYIYKIVTEKEIAEAIKSKKANVVYLSYVKLQSFENIAAGPKKRDQALNVIQDAESGQILALLNGSEPFDDRFFDYIAKAAKKSKK